MSSAHMNAADQRTPVADAFNTDNRYWGARFCRTDLVTPWKLLWHTAKRVKQFTTTARILPGKNPAHHVDWDPYRLSQGRDDFGDWIRWHWAWRRAGFGDPITFLLQTQKELDQQNPVQLLHRTIKYAVDHHKGDRSGWGAMIGDKSDRGAIIGRPKRMFMIQAAIFEHAGTWFDIPKGLGEEDLPVLLDIGSDAAKHLIRLCRERWKPEELEAAGFTPQHWLEQYKYGDPISLDEGRFFEFYPEAAPPPHILAQSRLNRPQAQVGPLKLSPQALRERRRRDDHDEEDGGRDIEGYTVNCLEMCGPDEYNLFGPQLTDFADQLEERVRPWSEILLFPTYKQQAEMIMPLLRLPSDHNPNGELRLDVIELAWVDHKDWWPDKSSDLWAEYVNRVSEPGSDLPTRRGREDTDGPAAGPALSRRPPVPRPLGSGHEDETLAARALAPAPAPAPEPESDAPPPRTRPGPRRLAPRPAAQTSVPATELTEEFQAAAEVEAETPIAITKRPEDADVADHFRKIAEEEAALRAQGTKPDFPTPGGRETSTTQRPDAWRDRLANRRISTPTSPRPAPEPRIETAPEAPPPPPFEPKSAQVNEPEADGGGFTPPPIGPMSPRERLAQLRNTTRKIPTA